MKGLGMKLPKRLKIVNREEQKSKRRWAKIGRSFLKMAMSVTYETHLALILPRDRVKSGHGA
jgi:hypothetical protein